MAQRFVTRDHDQPSNAAILMDRRSASQKRPVADRHMPAQQHGVGHDHIVSHVAIVSDMGGHHQHASIADPRRVVAVRINGSMDRRRFSDDDVVPDDQAHPHSVVLQMLRREPDIRSRSYFAILPGLGVPMNMGVLVNDGPRTRRTPALMMQYAADPNIIGKLSFWIDNRGRVNFSHQIPATGVRTPKSREG